MRAQRPITRPPLRWLTLAVIVCACSSESASPAPPDGPTHDAATSVADATPADADAAAAPPMPGELGGACCVLDGCSEVLACDYPMGACHEDSWGTPGGMCTVWCEGPDDPVCPEGSRCGCTPGGGPCACIFLCESDDDCRVDDGYRCCPGEGCMPAGWECS